MNNKAEDFAFYMCLLLIGAIPGATLGYGLAESRFKKCPPASSSTSGMTIKPEWAGADVIVIHNKEVNDRMTVTVSKSPQVGLFWVESKLIPPPVIRELELKGGQLKDKEEGK